ncbi:MAG: hypothetical protein AAF368_04625, partial [Planctomycetota bacterium]
MLSSLRLPKLGHGILLRALALTTLLPCLTQAQTQLVHYNPVGSVNEGNLPAQSTAPGITASSLRLVGAVGGNFSDSFHTLGWSNGPAPDPNRYIEFTTSGSYQAGSIRHHWFQTSFGPNRVSVRTSRDGFTNDIATGTKAGNVSLDIRCLGEVSGTITFRLYYYSGSFGLDSSTNAVFIDGGGQQGLKLFDAPPIPNQDCASAPHLSIAPTLSLTDLFVGDLENNGFGFGAGDNWFTFDIPPHSRVDIDALFSHEDANIDMTLYPGCILSVLTFSNTADDNEHIAHINTSPAFQTLSLRVFSTDFLGCAEYDLELEVTPLPCLIGPGDVFDNVFQCSNAVPVQLDTAVTDLIVRAGEFDYFGFDVQPGESVTASVFFEHEQGDLYLLGFENACSAIAGSSSTDTNDESMVFTNSTPVVQNFVVEVGIDPFETG